MSRSLYSKTVLIMVVFIIAVMCVVGTLLLSGVNDYYTDEFTGLMESKLAEETGFYRALSSSVTETGLDDNCIRRLSEVLVSRYTDIGIDDYRYVCILGTDGKLLSSSKDGVTVSVTESVLDVMGGADSSYHTENEYMDYARLVDTEYEDFIVYVYDSCDEMRGISHTMFIIIIQTVLAALIIAVILAVFLSKAIVTPIEELDKGIQTITDGDFSHTLDVTSDDEIGALTENFNKMSNTLRITLDEVKGERGKLQTVFSCLNDAVVAFGHDGKVLNINESAVDLFGDNYRDGFTFTDFISLMFSSDGKTPDFTFDELTGGEKVNPDIVFGDRVLEAAFGRITYPSENGEKDGVMIVLHDITERYALESSRKEFVANVSHELRTPLTSIKGACESVLEHEDMPSDVRESFLGMAIGECDRMTRIVGDLLILSRLDNNRTKWEVTEYDISESVERVCKVMKTESDTHGHTLTFTCNADRTQIKADKEKIEQVVINIISNSIKYTPDGGKISVSLSNTQNGVAISIKDNGIGIPEDDAKHIFERFYRVEKSRSVEAGGTGLGLAIAKEITVAHGGDITVSNVPKGGTEMCLTLPFVCKI